VNAPIRRLGVLIAALFVGLLVATTSIQVVQAPSLRALSFNRRTLLDNYSRDRGAILIAGKPVARSVKTDDDLGYLRTYPQAALFSHVTGYYSFTYGAGGGIEGSSDALLAGTADELFYQRISDLLTGTASRGATLELTINPKAQQAASDALGNQRGAVVALDPRTGAILAMVSHPQYDPNQLSGHDLDAVEAAMKRLTADKTTPLVNRAIGGNLYPPGSVFKIVTAAAALSTGAVTEQTMIPAPASMDLPESSAPLPNYDLRACGPNNETTLRHALEISCNTAFGWIGLKVGATALHEQAKKFGFESSLRVPMRVTSSVFPADLDRPHTAQSAIGQFDVRVTPLQVAMISAAIANNGVLMKPYLVGKVLGPNLETIDSPTPEVLSQAVSPQVAATIRSMMVSVVETGTGRPARIDGISVAGKTGTAEQGNGKPPHAWFTAFAPADNPQIAVAVVVEDGGNLGEEAAGGRLAGPIARAVMKAVIG
jgi:peptidoglycan glycosyltransferase